MRKSEESPSSSVSTSTTPLPSTVALHSASSSPPQCQLTIPAPLVPLTFFQLLNYGHRLLEYIQDDYLTLSLGLTAVLINSITNLTFPWLIGQAVDRAAKGQNSSEFKSYLLTTSGILLLGSIASYVRVYCLSLTNHRIMNRMKQALYRSYLQHPLEWFHETPCGELITLLDKDLNSASQIYTDLLPSTLRSLNSSLNGSILLYLNSPKLCGITLLSVPIVGIGAMFMAIKSSKQTSALRELTSTGLTHTIERLNNILTIKINGKENYEMNSYQISLERILSQAKQLWNAQGAFMSYLNFTTNGCLLLVLYVGGSMLGTGEITSGNLTTFAIQSGFVGLGYSGLSSAYKELREALIACQRCVPLTSSSLKE
jgi:ABC-type multidrug transport system fused ATPase/permease subunit